MMQVRGLVLLPVVLVRGIQLVETSSYGALTCLAACCCLGYWTQNAFQASLVALLGLSSAAPTSEDIAQTLYAWLAGTPAWPVVLSAPLILDLWRGLPLCLLTAACLSSSNLLKFQSLPQSDVCLLLQSALLCWNRIAQPQALTYPTSNYLILSRALFISAASLVTALSLAVRHPKSKELILCTGTVLAAIITLSAPYETPAGELGGNLFSFTLDRVGYHKILVAYELMLIPISLYLGLTKALSAPQDANCEISTMASAAKKPYILGRKFFHLVTALIALPQALSDPYFMSVAWAVCLLAYGFAEGYRVVDFAGLAQPINALVLPLTDKRDREGLLLTPFFLGLGTCVTLWIETFRGVNFSPYRASIGLTATCIADGVAGIAGTFSSKKWRLYGSGDNGKTVQGTVAFIVSYVLFSMAELEVFARWEESERLQVLPAVFVAALVSGLVEAYTKSIDNFVVALVAYITHYTFCGLYIQ